MLRVGRASTAALSPSTPSKSMRTNLSLRFFKSRPRLALSLAISLVALLVFATGGYAQSGTWTNNPNGTASGTWSAATNWDNNIIASGADNTANFSTLDITNLSTVTLDGARTIGNILLGDVNPSANWAIATGTGGPLMLAVTAGSPTLTANNGSNIVTAVLTGVSGLTKAGPGTLRLNAANPNLQNLVFVNDGILQIGNAQAAGTNGNQLGNDRVICTNGATLEIMNAVQPNNKHLTLLGAGVGGTQGALYANATSGSTRWGLSSLNASGTSANSSAAFPGVSLYGDQTTTTIRIDGDAIGAPTVSFAIGHVSGTNATLIKTGGGRLSFDRGVSGITNLIIQGGGYQPNSPGGFGSIQYYTVAAGAAIVNNQNNCFSAFSSIVMSPGSLVDINNRADVQTYTQNIGYLNGSGTLTAGTRTGAGGTHTLTINGSDSNSVFNGQVTVTNGTFRLTKNGSAALVLNGNNTYNGLTIVNGGSLTLNGINSGLGGIQMGAGTTLSGTGTIASPITNLSAIIDAGDPAVLGGKMTVLSNIIGNFSDTINISNATLAVSGRIGPDFQTVGILYMTNGTLELPLRTLGASASVQTLNVDGNATIKFSMDTPLLGHFPLISYGSIGGLAGFTGFLPVVAPPGITATLSNNTANFTIDVVISAIPALTWEGSPAGVWNVGVGNWKGGALFANGQFVVFDDTALGTTSVTLGGTVSPQGVTVNNSSLNYTFSGSGKISGSGGIAKQGSGSLTVLNSGNDFTGAVNLQQGTLQLGNGGATGDLGSGSIANQGTLALNRSDSFTLANTVSGNGAITKAGAGTVTVPVSGDSSGAVTVGAGTLQLGPVGTSKFTGDVTGSGAFGVNGLGKVILNSFLNTYSGGTVITSGTLQFGDELNMGTLPPAGNITDNGTLATTISGTLANNISGSGGVSLLASAAVTLSGANSYTGPTVVLGGSVDATASTYPAGSPLVLGSQGGTAEIGAANFGSGNIVLGGLKAGGNSGTANTVNLGGGNQTLSANGNVIVGNIGPVAAVANLQITGLGVSVVVNTNGGVIQLGLGASGSGVNPDSVTVDFSTIDSFVANLGATGLVNLGTLDGNPGPPSGATVPNVLRLAAVSNSITAGRITIGAGGRQLIPELRLGAGTNDLNVDTLTVGGGGRDGGSLLFDTPAGGLRVRANDGVSRASLNVGFNPATGTGASITNTVDLTGHPVDLLLGSVVIGNYNNAGIYQNTVSFSQGTLDATNVSLSVLRNNNANAPLSSSTLNIGGGTASLGQVSLTGSAAPGALNITGGNVTVSGITSPGAGAATLDLTGCTLNINIPGFGNPSAAPVRVDTLNASGTVNVGVNGTGLSVGQFPLMSYSGTIGGAGFPAFSLASLPAGVSATLSNNTANASVDLVIAAAPFVVNPYPSNILVSASGGVLGLSWPGQLGWILQSNSVGVASPATWFEVPGSATVTTVNIPLDPAKPNVFFRLVRP